MKLNYVYERKYELTEKSIRKDRANLLYSFSRFFLPILQSFFSIIFVYVQSNTVYNIHYFVNNNKLFPYTTLMYTRYKYIYILYSESLKVTSLHCGINSSVVKYGQRCECSFFLLYAVNNTTHKVIRYMYKWNRVFVIPYTSTYNSF